MSTFLSGLGLDRSASSKAVAGQWVWEHGQVERPAAHHEDGACGRGT